MKKIILICALLSAVCALAFAQSDTEGKTPEERIAELEKENRKIIAELDDMKRANAASDAQAVSLTQKEQWGQGWGVSFGLIQALGIDESGFNMNAVFPLTGSVIFPRIKNKIGIETSFAFGFGLTMFRIDLSPTFKFTSPLMFNFARTYWGFGILASAEFDADGWQMATGLSSLFTGLEMYVGPKRSFYVEAGVAKPVMISYESTPTVDTIKAGFTASPSMEMGMRFYF
jgi:hypothetical protein